MADTGRVRESLMMSQEQVDDLNASFQTVDADGNGFISLQELGNALTAVGFKLPQYEVRDLVEEFDRKTQDGKLDFDEFKALYARLKSEKDIGHGFKKAVSKRQNVETRGGTSLASVEGTTHSIRKEEQVAFSNWINRNLQDDPDCGPQNGKYLPIDPESRDLYEKCKDGILLCKMVNKSTPGTIDERVINKTNLSVYRAHENLTLALQSSQAIGCNIVNIGANDLNDGVPHLLLGLLWQIIRIGLLSDINLHEHPGLVLLLRDGETLEEFKKLSPEEILIRWVNYHLENANSGRQIANFSGDIKDSVPYTYLLHQIAPRDSGVSLQPLQEGDLDQRAEAMLVESDKIGCRSFVTAQEVVKGNPKLNLAFVANLFNMYPALEKPEDFEISEEDMKEESREEKTYRNWMNSLGVSPYVNHLYSDLQDGLIIFQIYDQIKPGMVDWKLVTTKFSKLKMFMEKIENCNYAVKLGSGCKFSLVGIAGNDINDGNETLTLALIWQLMKAYTLSLLKKLSDDDRQIIDAHIVEWANEKLKSAGKKSSFRNFQDQSLANGHAIIDLVDAIKPKAVNYDLVKGGEGEELSVREKMANAKYAISMARKIGARVYALPEDIVEVKAKMIMTVFTCLMIRDFQAKEASSH